MALLSHAQLDAYGGIRHRDAANLVHNSSALHRRRVPLTVAIAACAALFSGLAGFRAMPTPFQIEALMLATLASSTATWYAARERRPRPSRCRAGGDRI